MSEIECPTCGKTGFKNERGMKMHHSMAHNESIAGSLYECEWCGESVRKLEADVVGRTFCDSDCYGSYKKEFGPSGEEHPLFKENTYNQYYGANWEEQRSKAIERDFESCRMCGVEEDRLHVHHRTPFRFFDDWEKANKLHNLITLCADCHGDVEQSDMVPDKIHGV